MKRRMRVIVCVLIFSISISSFSTFTPKAEAFSSAAIVAQLIQQLIVMKKELSAIQSQLENLKPGVNISGLTKSFKEIRAIRNAVMTILFDYSKVQSQWDNQYKDFKTINGMSATQYATYLQTIDQETSKALRDAATAQGLIIQLDGDQTNLEKLLATTKSAKGALAVMQAANQIAALQVYQLMRMQTIMAMSYRAQTMYYQWEMQEKMTQRAYAQKNQIKLENPITKASDNGLFPQF